MADEKREGSCTFCGNDFRIEALVGGKCPSCVVSYKGFNTKEEYVKSKKTETKSQLFNQDVVREMIYEILAEFGLERKLCDKCGQIFCPKSPAAKQCENCRNSGNAGKPKETK